METKTDPPVPMRSCSNCSRRKRYLPTVREAPGTSRQRARSTLNVWAAIKSEDALHLNSTLKYTRRKGDRVVQ